MNLINNLDMGRFSYIIRHRKRVETFNTFIDINKFIFNTQETWEWLLSREITAVYNGKGCFLILSAIIYTALLLLMCVYTTSMKNVYL